MKYLPFENTNIPARRSLSEIQAMLEETGFTETGQININGQNTIVAGYKGATFRFEVYKQNIIDTLIKNLGERTKIQIRNKTPQGISKMIDIDKQAMKIGWRLIYLQVKALCDSIKLGVITPAQAFAGYLVTGQNETLADRLTESIETGKLKSNSILSPLLIEE